MPDTHIEQSQLFIRLCSDHLSIEAIPKKQLLIDLENIRERKLNHHEIILWTPHFVVLKNRKGHEVTLRKDGRMIIRKAESEQLAQQSASDALNLVLGICGQ